MTLTNEKVKATSKAKSFIALKAELNGETLESAFGIIRQGKDNKPFLCQLNLLTYGEDGKLYLFNNNGYVSNPVTESDIVPILIRSGKKKDGSTFRAVAQADKRYTEQDLKLVLTLEGFFKR